MIALDPQPWDAGAVAAILPELANACSDIDWSEPLTEWSRETVVEFLLKAMSLIRKAMIARDVSEKRHHAKIECRYDRAPGQRGRRWAAHDPRRA